MRRLITSLALVAALSACSDPLSDIARLSDVPAGEANAAVAPSASEAQGGGGLFGRLLNRPSDDPTNAAIDAALADAGAVVPEPQSEPRNGGGLFGLFRRDAPADVPRTGPDNRDVAEGTLLPFGEIARICGLQRNQLGRQVSNDAGFRIFDSNPSSTTTRAFYITGFNDNCARTFAGAVVIPGDIQTHEFVRYQPSNERIDYTTVDNAYEALKASICRVGRGQPCGGRSDRLNRNTQFITVYGFFGGTFSAVPTEWVQILLHDGEVLAISLKDG
ncbi:MAG: hypothetical protein AAGL89_08200 [Pseudomonadota bacterium]